jgi:hypothetical protein
MRKTLGTLMLAALVLGATPTIAAEAAATIPAAAPGHYSVKETLVGLMLDDPAANKLLKELIPGVYANEMFQSMGRDNTLLGIQQFEPEALKDEVLAKVQTELNKLPAKK